MCIVFLYYTALAVLISVVNPSSISLPLVIGGKPAKRGRPRKHARACLEDRYPTLSLVESDLSEYESNVQALKVELERSNPRKDVYLPLMKHTFRQRREFILSGAQSCAEITHRYPGLKLSACVCFNCMSFSWYIYII